MLAVNLNQTADLRHLADSRRRNRLRLVGDHGDLNEATYLKLAEHYLGKGLIDEALSYCELALQFDPYDEASFVNYLEMITQYGEYIGTRKSIKLFFVILGSLVFECTMPQTNVSMDSGNGKS